MRVVPDLIEPTAHADGLSLFSGDLLFLVLCLGLLPSWSLRSEYLIDGFRLDFGGCVDCSLRCICRCLDGPTVGAIADDILGPSGCNVGDAEPADNELFHMAPSFAGALAPVSVGKQDPDERQGGATAERRRGRSANQPAQVAAAVANAPAEEVTRAVSAIEETETRLQLCQR